nr:laccase-6 [Ipomoea batatas]
MLRLINAAVNQEHFFGIANHNLTIVEADAEYTKPFTTGRVMLGPGQTLNLLVTANQPIGKYSMAMGPYQSAKNITFQTITSVAYFTYLGALPSVLARPAPLPPFNDSLAVKTVMDGLKSPNPPPNMPKQIDQNMFITIGLNVQRCQARNPEQNCRGFNGGVMSASMNNVSFVKPKVSLLEAYYRKINGQFTEDFPGSPLGFYDFVNGAPNNAPNDTSAVKGTRTYVLEYGSRVQIILQDTGTVSTENHPIHFHGYSFYVVGYGSGNYDPEKVSFNLVDPPYMNTIGVPVGGWAAIRFTADNPGSSSMAHHAAILGHLSQSVGWGKWVRTLTWIMAVGAEKQPHSTHPKRSGQNRLHRHKGSGIVGYQHYGENGGDENGEGGGGQSRGGEASGLLKQAE